MGDKSVLKFVEFTVRKQNVYLKHEHNLICHPDVVVLDVVQLLGQASTVAARVQPNGCVIVSARHVFTHGAQDVLHASRNRSCVMGWLISVIL